MPEREKLILDYPCFAMLSPAESRKLAALMTEIHFASGEIIVRENTIVDSIYLLVSGQAEVTRETIPAKHRIKLIQKPLTPVTILLAILTAGDAIGLDDKGFYSKTGLRTATVRALSDVSALSLDLKKLHDFLQEYPHLHPAMLIASEQMLRTQFIKQTLPFSRLPHERLVGLAKQVEEVQIPKGTVLFREGEQGSSCYLVRSGQIEILTHKTDGTEHQLAILESPALFGEATLITHTSRNATARALTDCELLELKYEYLSELIESENNVANMFMTLSLDRSRPLQKQHITEHQRCTSDGQTIVILKNIENGNYFKLSGEGWYVWQQMDGQQTMQEITMALAEAHDIFAPDLVAGLIYKLSKADFLANVTVTNPPQQSFLTRIFHRIQSLMETRVAFTHVDQWLTRLYQNGGFLLFSPFCKIIFGVLIIVGFFAFGLSTSHVINLFRTIHDSWILVVFLIPFTLMTVALHELGHALATKSYGREVNYMGVGWHWLGPIAFVDTSDMWLSAKWPRIFVNLAGVYTDLLVAGVSSLLIFVMPGAHIQAFLWIFALYTYLNAFRMLNPLQELDGYYVLMDLFDRPRLRKHAIAWLIKDFPEALHHPALFRKSFPEVLYWIVSIIFIISVSVLTLMVQTFVFKIAGFKPVNPFVVLALPALAALVSSIDIIVDVRNRADEY